VKNTKTLKNTTLGPWDWLYSPKEKKST